MTRIIIAHRPETIASADRIIALREGRIAEENLRAAPNVPALRTSTTSCCAA